MLLWTKFLCLGCWRFFPFFFLHFLHGDARKISVWQLAIQRLCKRCTCLLSPLFALVLPHCQVQWRNTQPNGSKTYTRTKQTATSKLRSTLRNTRLTSDLGRVTMTSTSSCYYNPSSSISHDSFCYLGAPSGSTERRRGYRSSISSARYVHITRAFERGWQGASRPSPWRCYGAATMPPQCSVRVHARVLLSPPTKTRKAHKLLENDAPWASPLVLFTECVLQDTLSQKWALLDNRGMAAFSCQRSLEIWEFKKMTAP